MNTQQTFSALLATSLVFGAASFASAGDRDIRTRVHIGGGNSRVDLSYAQRRGNGHIDIRVGGRDRHDRDRGRYDGRRGRGRGHDSPKYDRGPVRGRGPAYRDGPPNRRYEKKQERKREHRRYERDHERRRYEKKHERRHDRRRYEPTPPRRRHYQSPPRPRYNPAPPRPRYEPAPAPYEHRDHGYGYGPQTQQERSAWILLAKGKVYKSQILFGRALGYDEHRASAKFGYAVSAARQGDDYTAAMAMRRAFKEDFGTLSSMPDFAGLYRQFDALAKRMHYEIYEYGETTDRLVVLAGVEILRGDNHAALEALEQAKYLGDDSLGVKRALRYLRH